MIRHKTRALHDKRTRDVERNGGNCTLERDVVCDLVRAWEVDTGRRAIVLNDFTRADALLQVESGDFLPVQMKSTRGTVKSRNTWKFASVGRYSDMPVVCWRCDVGDAWLFDGAALQGYGTSRSTAAAVSKPCLEKNMEMTRLVSFSTRARRGGVASQSIPHGTTLLPRPTPRK